MSVTTTKIREAFTPISTGVDCVVNDMKVFDQDQITVYVGDTSEVAVRNTDYTIAIAGDFSGCTVTPLAPLTARASKLVVARLTPLTSDFAITRNGKVDEPRLTEQLDRNVMRLQEDIGKVNRALRVTLDEASIAELPSVATRAGNLLAFDTLGAPVVLPFAAGDLIVADTALNVKAYGAVLDGSTNDAPALAAAIAAAKTLKRDVFIPKGTLLYNDAAGAVIDAIGVRIIGAGPEVTSIKAGAGMGAGTALLNYTSASGECRLTGLKLDTNGRDVRCIDSPRGQTLTCFDVAFDGNRTGELVKSTGDILQLWLCKFDLNAAGTIGVLLDAYNQNDAIAMCRFGGIGSGVKLTQTNGAQPRVEGLRIVNNVFINTGAFNVDIGNSLLTLIADNVLDQAADNSVAIRDGADLCLVTSNWLGLQPSSVGTCVLVYQNVGFGTLISGNTTNGGKVGVAVAATVGDRVDRISITNNMFASHTDHSLALDSVANCTITGNQDGGTPTNGSWITSATFGAGSYTFDNNRWHTQAPVLFHTGSSYLWGNDAGIVAKKRGSAAVGSGAATVGISHGLFTTPSRVMVSYQYTTGLGSFFTNTYTPTNFTVTWGVATPDANCIIHWEAEV